MALTAETIADLKRERSALAKIPEPTRQQRTAVTTTMKAFKPNHPMHIAAAKEKQRQEDATGKVRIAAIDAILAAYGDVKPVPQAPSIATMSRGKVSPMRLALRAMLKEHGEMSNAQIITELTQQGFDATSNSIGNMLSTGTEFDRVGIGIYRLVEFND